MTRYRIAPEGPDEWKVQTQWFGIFWVNMYRSVAADYSELVTFPTEAEAEAWIEKVLDYERRMAKWHSQDRERKRQLRPRVYP